MMTLDCETRILAASQLLASRRTFRSGRNHCAALMKAFRACLLTNTAIQIVSYWGIGGRAATGRSEVAALAFQQTWLSELARLLRAPIAVEYVLTDTHATINGVPARDMELYIASATALLRDHGFTVRRMSAVLFAAYGTTDTLSARDISIAWNALAPRAAAELERLASLRGGAPDRHSRAQHYYAQNLSEAAAVRALLPSSIFLTYQPPGMDYLAPALPTLHVYVGTGQKTKRPWFDVE